MCLCILLYKLDVQYIKPNVLFWLILVYVEFKKNLQWREVV